MTPEYCKIKVTDLKICYRFCGWCRKWFPDI